MEYLDAIAGVAVTSLGHGHPEIAAAIAEQAALLMHTSNVFRVEWQERLASACARWPGWKGVLLQFRRRGQRGRARWRACTATAAGAAADRGDGERLSWPHAGDPVGHRQSGQAKGFEPLLPGFLRVPYDDIAAVRQLAEQRDDIVAVLLEPVQGEGGIRVAGADYLRDLRALCDRHGWLLMLDEIQAGMGRTGAWFGHQHAGIAPDVMTLAKALGSSFPIGACLARGPAADLFSPGQHGSPSAAIRWPAAWPAVLDIMARDGMPQRAAALGQRLLAGLRRALEGHPQVVAVRGQGLMAGIELDRNCQELVGRALAEQRLLITVTRERTIRLLPPLVCDEAQIDEIVARLARMLSGDSAQAITPSNAAGPVAAGQTETRT